MLREKKIRKILASFFAGVYLFVALFSQNFHHHGSAEIFKDFHFKKSEKTFTSAYLSTDFTDCLSCHILHSGNSLVPEEFSYHFRNFNFAEQLLFIVQQPYYFQKTAVLFLRGPPNVSFNHQI